MESKKKLFYWDFLRIIALFFVFYPIFGGAKMNPQNLAGSSMEIGLSELLTNDGHIWGDIPWLLTGIDLRGPIWTVSQPVIVLLSFLWAYKNYGFAKKIRIANWVLALFLYAGYTIFLPTSQQYDYFIYAYALAQTGWQMTLFISFITSLLMMWLGVILISGYYIYKSLKEENSAWAKRILFLLSMGVPGFGHIATGKIKRGIAFMVAGFAIWAIDFYMFFLSPFAFIPTLLFWLYAARDAQANA